MNIATWNWFAVIAATLATFLMGYLWYSPLLFGKAWKEAAGIKEEEGDKPNMTKILSLFFIFSFVMAINLAIFLNDSKTNMVWGATAGLMAGLGWVAMSIFITGQFEKRTTRYMLIHGGYYVVCFVIMGAILGGWR